MPCLSPLLASTGLPQSVSRVTSGHTRPAQVSACAGWLLTCARGTQKGNGFYVPSILNISPQILRAAGGSNLLASSGRLMSTAHQPTRCPCPPPASMIQRQVRRVFWLPRCTKSLPGMGHHLVNMDAAWLWGRGRLAGWQYANLFTVA